MANTDYITLEIPSFNNLGLNPEEIIKCQKLYEKICFILREECSIFEIHLGLAISTKLKEEMLKSMISNCELIKNEIERREKGVRDSHAST